MKKNLNKIKFNLPVNSKAANINFTKIKKSEQILPQHNIGIRTGKINNLTIVDIDTSDSGLLVYNKWFDDYHKSEFLKKVYKVRTPSGGIHLYFNYNSLLKNLIKINGYGIDIRNDNAYIVGAGSSINNRKYTYIEGTLGYNIPQWLMDWIIKPSKKQDDKPSANKPIKLEFDKNLFSRLTVELSKNKENYSYFIMQTRQK